MKEYYDDLEGDLYESQEKIEELERKIRRSERDREEVDEERDSKHSREVKEYILLNCYLHNRPNLSL